MQHMYTRLFLFAALLALPLLVEAQNTRYLDPIFSTTRTNGIQYGAAAPHNSTTPAPLLLDMYEPTGDTAARRPVVLTIFGGSFIGGSTNAADIVAWSDSLARRGYVAVAVGYRVGFNVFRTGAVVRAGYRALQDGRAAVRYLKEHADSFRLDTNQIYIVGNSAGAITALQIAYADDTNRPAESYGIPGGGSDSTDMGCMDCSGNNFAHTVEIKAVVGLWGAVLDLAGADSSDQTAALMFHSTDDTVVPIDSGNAQGVATFPIIYGSRLIHNKLIDLGKYSELYVYEGLGHNFYYTGGTFPNAYWDSIRVPSINFLCRFNTLCDTTQIVSVNRQRAEAVSNDMLLFPNPAKELLHFQLPSESLAGAYSIEIYNAQGQAVHSERAYLQPAGEQIQTLTLRDMPAGFYVLRLQHEGSGAQTAKQFVVRP